MNSAFIVILLCLCVFAGIIGTMIWIVLKRVDPKNQDKSEDPQVKEAQAFLPFLDIQDNMIILPNNNYRMVLECSSLNYSLKTEAERNQIDFSFQRFLNSISFPISFFLQTKTIDNRERLETLDKNIGETLKHYPAVRTYAKAFREEMRNINESIGNSHQKKRYIIVSYDDVSTLDSLSPEEQDVYARKAIFTRCNGLISGLNGVGIHAHVLNTAELIELIYSCYYRDDFSYAECIASKEPFALFVDGTGNKLEQLDKEGQLHLLFEEVKNRIRLENLDATNEGQRLLDAIINMEGPYEEK